MIGDVEKSADRIDEILNAGNGKSIGIKKRGNDALSED